MERSFHTLVGMLCIYIHIISIIIIMTIITIMTITITTIIIINIYIHIIYIYYVYMIYIYIYTYIDHIYCLHFPKTTRKVSLQFFWSMSFCCVSKVQTRIAAELGPSSSLILDVPKWLLLNSCRFPDQGICVDQKVLGSL